MFYKQETGWFDIPINSRGDYLQHSVKIYEKNILCPVCSKSVCDTKLVPCGHIVHWFCYNPCDLQYTTKCPICNVIVTDWLVRKLDVWTVHE
jgi:hypothetical protein